MSQQHSKGNWIDRSDDKSKKTKHNEKPLVIPAINTSPFEITQAALKERLIYLQQEEKQIIGQFTDAILNEQDYSELSEQMKNKQKEIMHVKARLKHMDMSPL